MERCFTEHSAMNLESLSPLSNVGIELPIKHGHRTAKNNVGREKKDEEEEYDNESILTI